MDNEFKRRDIQTKPRKVRAFFTSNKREEGRVLYSNEKGIQERAYERLGLAGYSWTVLSVGLAVGLVFGGPLYDLVIAKRDNQLVQDARYYNNIKN